MNSFFEKYTQLIFEAEDEIVDNIEETEDIEETEETEINDNSDLVLVFSADLLSEFNRTVNEFTDICAQISESQGGTKEVKQQFTNLYKKIKDLVDAAKV